MRTGRSIPRKVIGSLAGGVLGLVYVVINAGVLPSPAAVVIRVLGVVAFLGLLVRVRLASVGATSDLDRCRLRARVLAGGRRGGARWGGRHRHSQRVPVRPRVGVAVGLPRRGGALLRFGDGVAATLLPPARGRHRGLRRGGPGRGACRRERGCRWHVAGVAPGALLLAAGCWGTRRARDHTPRPAGSRTRSEVPTPWTHRWMSSGDRRQPLSEDTT